MKHQRGPLTGETARPTCILAARVQDWGTCYLRNGARDAGSNVHTDRALAQPKEPSDRNCRDEIPLRREDVAPKRGAEVTMLEAILLTAMIDLLHPKFQAHSYEKEPLEEAERRYGSIAEDMAAVVSDEQEAPLFTGPAAREVTGLLLATIAWHESGFRKDVDACKGTMAKGDNGRSIGLLQVMRGPNYEGHTSKEICGDRRLALRLGLHVLRRAKETCTGGPRTWLQSYASGSCSIHSNVSRDVCSAFERIGQKKFTGLSCESTGPVAFREPPGS
jgi:hypothetical protein